MEAKEYRGYNGIMILTDTGIIIKRGARGFLLGGGMLRGDKTIPYSSVVAVQLKKAGLLAGYFQLTLKGGSDAKRGLFQSALDENTINFHRGKNNNKLFLEAKEIIEKKINDLQNGGLRVSSADELSKFAELRDKGVITKEEFESKKKQILGS